MGGTSWVFLSTVSSNELPQFGMALILVCLVIRGLLLERQPKIFASGKSLSELLQFTGVRGEYRKLQDRVFNLLVYIQRVAIISLLVLFVSVILLGLAGL